MFSDVLEQHIVISTTELQVSRMPDFFFFLMCVKEKIWLAFLHIFITVKNNIKVSVSQLINRIQIANLYKKMK